MQGENGEDAWLWRCQGPHNFSPGTVYLREKLGIPSLVSVELESEDRLLLEGRDPGLRSIRSGMNTLLPYMLQEYHQDIISAVWTIILSRHPEDPVWAGAILLCFLICAHSMLPRIKYYQAIILVVGWMMLLSPIPEQDPGLRDLRTTSTLQRILLQEYHQDIISAVWIIILSLYQDGFRPHWVFRLSFLIYVHAMRPRIEYHQAIILVGWMILLCLIPDRGPGLRDFRTRSTFQAITLQVVHQSIILVAWMNTLSPYREDPVRVGAILLSLLVYLHTMRPRIEHPQAVILVGLMILLSIISGLVQAPAVFLFFSIHLLFLIGVGMSLLLVLRAVDKVRISLARKIPQDSGILLKSDTKISSRGT